MDRQIEEPAKSTPHTKGGWKAILILIAAMIYGIIPVDAIPDIIPVFGLGDDALAVLGAIFYFYRVFIMGKSRRKAP